MSMFLFSLLLLCPGGAAHSTWCGKYYDLDAPRTPPSPDSRFTHPPASSEPLLDFRCNTASSLYLPDDDVNDPPAMLFDANVTWDIGQPCKFSRMQMS